MSKRTYLDRKGSRKMTGRPSTSKKKKHFPVNRFSMEKDEANTSASSKKLKSTDAADIEIDASFGYRIINFVSVFSIISEAVKCKKCGGKVEFTEVSNRGLGFKIKLSCASCEPTFAYSSPLINNKAYDINRRIVLAFRLLGIGLAGIEKFCGIMDMPRPIFHSFYEKVVNIIHIAAKTVCESSMKNAVKNEKEKQGEKQNVDGLTVSGDGSWRKRGFSSLFGIATIIGYHTGKVLDVVIKSSYCKVCEFWNKFEGTEEYEEWQKNHEGRCSANHEGSAGKMEPDAICEMFKRSEELYGEKYTNYIGDGDSKTYKSVVNSKPYGDTEIKKKECIGHVQKRMGTHLRKVKKDKKGLGGRGKLTAKLIDELTVYYGLAIRRHSESKEEMKNAIWATFLHKISTNDKPQHHLCPSGEDSWCTWQKAKASGSLKNYNHASPLSTDVQDAIKPIYETLSNDDLLERCLGGFTQNNNESVNSVIWSMAPKVTSSGAKIVEIATYIACSVFNDGYENVLLIMQQLNLKIGPNAQRMCEEQDKARITIADIRAEEATKNARKLRRAAQKESADITAAIEGVVYGPGIAE